METSLSDGVSLLSLSAQMPPPPPRPPSVASNRSKASSRPSSAASQYPRPTSASGRRASSSRPSSSASHYGRPSTSPLPPPTPSLPGPSTSLDASPGAGLSLSDELARAGSVDHAASPPSPPPPVPARRSRPGSGVRRGRRRSDAAHADSSSSSSSFPSPTSDSAPSDPPTTDSQPLTRAPQQQEGPLAAAFAKRMASSGAAVTVTRGPQVYSEAERLKYEGMVGEINERGSVDLVPWHPTMREAALRKGAKFARDVGSACVLVARDGIWPLVADIAQMPASLQASSSSNASASVPRKPRRSRSVSQKLSASFAERFKYTICTSFLLTSSLSISFYDSAPPLEPDSGAEEQSEDGGEQRQLPTIVVQGGRGQRATGPIDAAPGRLGPRSKAPYLKPAGRMVRNAVVLALLASWPLASSRDAWFRAALVLVALAWSSIVVFKLHHPTGPSNESSIAFVVTHTARDAAPVALLPSPPEQDGDSDGPSLVEQHHIKQEAVSCAQRLIRSAKAFDIAANRTISAIQEVEIVSRGYKITHPLPPISRIEASNGSLYRSPTKQRTTSWAAGGILSRSASNGASAGNSWRSGGLSRSGSLKGYSSSASSEARAESRRLMTLRKGLVQAFEQAESYLRQALSSLEGRVDGEELALLRDMYVLDGTRALDGLVGETSLGDTSAIMEPQSAPAWSSNTITAGMMAAQSRKRVSLLDSNGPFSPVKSTSAGGGMTASTTMDEGVGGTPTHKRLSLLSDGGLGISAGADPTPPSAATTTGSRRSSRILDGTAPRSGSRLGYINSSSSVIDSPSNPNESAAAKRLSYMSSASSAAGGVVIPGTSATATTNSSWTAGSRSGSRPPSMSLTHQTSDVGASPAPSGRRGSGAAPLGHYNTESSGLSRKRGSLMALGLGSPLPPHTPTATPHLTSQTGLAPSPQFGDLAHDPVSLMGLKSAFEGMHLLRRRLLCNLLALDFTLGAPGGGTALQGSNVEAYWDSVVASMVRLADRLDDLREELETSLTAEMGFGAPRNVASRFSRHGKTASAADILHPSPPPSRYEQDHTGIEDRAEAMGLALRSIQSKLRVCTEELRMRPPSALHGSEDGESSRPPSISSHPSHAASSTSPPNDAAPPSDVAEKVLESVREDLLALSAEWESALKIVRTERRRSPPQPQSPPAGGHLDSPSEAEEDAARGGLVKGSESEQPSSIDAAFEGYAKEHAKMPWATSASVDLSTGAGSGRQEDTSLSDLLLAATSPDHLPPPGLEQVYEAIAGLAHVLPENNAAAAGGKMSREERIQAQRKARLQAQEAALAAQEVLDRRGGMISDTAVVAELRGVLDVRKRQREALGGGDAGAAKLGSPLHLDDAVSSGRFAAPMPSPHAQAPAVPPRRVPISSSAAAGTGRSDESLATIREAASRAASSKSLNIVDAPLPQFECQAHDEGVGETTSADSRAAAAANAAQAAAAAMSRRLQGEQV